MEEQFIAEEQFIGLCHLGDLEGAKRLLEIYPDIDTSYEDECAFDDACINGYLEIAKWLLQLNPNINISYNNEQAFRYACINNQLELAKWLLSVKPDINISADNHGAFRWVCRYKHLEVAEWLQSLKPYLYVIEYSKNGKYIRYKIRSKEEAIWENRKYALHMALQEENNLLYHLPIDIAKTVTMFV
jgi:ankyrin repeat protein